MEDCAGGEEAGGEGGGCGELFEEGGAQLRDFVEMVIGDSV